MQNYNLTSTKRTLSAIFALVVFLISITLAGVFLSYKYISASRDDKLQFIVTSSEMRQQMDNEADFLERFSKRKDGLRNMDQEKVVGPMRRFLFTNFVIVDNQSNEVLFWNINRDFDVRSLVGTELEKGFSTMGSIMIHTLSGKNLLSGKTVIFFQDLEYNFQEYLRDILRFTLISFLSSILFYFIGINFVSRNLKPVEDNITDMQNFVHNAGHELKTPISVIHSNLQLLLEIKKYDAELMKESLCEIERMNTLIEGLVDLSDIQSKKPKQTLDLNHEIEEVLKSFSETAKKQGVKLQSDIQSTPSVQAHPEYFAILLGNLVNNAIKYNKKKGTVKVILQKDNIQVQDSGIGIEKKDFAKVFDRFYKVNTARNSSGHGIGLSLVRKIASMYGWKISIDSTIGEGTTIKIKFR